MRENEQGREPTRAEREAIQREARAFFARERRRERHETRADLRALVDMLRTADIRTGGA